MSLDWQAVGAVAAVVSAIGGAVAAVAAWKAASASEATSRHALEALALIERPVVRSRGVYNFEGTAAVVVANDSQDWDARDVTVSVLRRDGRTFKGSAGWLRAQPTTEILQVEIGEIDPSTQGGFAALVVDQVTIFFSDHRRIATYERREDYSALTSPDAPRVTEERIFGPLST